mmetsp:Transcript_24938/g.59977  ORF Transcript_24938/g.59977 Transcript_24938/m.59977 type:complete len:205 (-) Transcript_24938:378-992(-)
MIIFPILTSGKNSLSTASIAWPPLTMLTPNTRGSTDTGASNCISKSSFSSSPSSRSSSSPSGMSSMGPNSLRPFIAIFFFRADPFSANLFEGWCLEQAAASSWSVQTIPSTLLTINRPTLWTQFRNSRPLVFPSRNSVCKARSIGVCSRMWTVGGSSWSSLSFDDLSFSAISIELILSRKEWFSMSPLFFKVALTCCTSRLIAT